MTQYSTATPSIVGVRYSVAGTIWIDLENSPHVPFFIPIIRELERAGCQLILTARDFAQTKELVNRAGLNARIVGGTYGNSTAIKTMGILCRALRLAWMMRGKNISLAVGHGSRGILLAARMLRVPILTLYDYEGASVSLFNRLSTYVMTPEAIPFTSLEQLGLTKEKHCSYPGLKEDVYVPSFQPDESIIRDLNLDSSRIIITMRPPSHTAHYRSEASFELFDAMMNLLGAREDIQMVMLPRERSKDNLFHPNSNIIVPPHAVDGLNVLYHSDLVISGGGTMNREAAALGIPTVTIFKGPTGAVDAWLMKNGRMRSVDRAEEILPMLRKREHTSVPSSNLTKEIIVEAILKLVTRT